MDSQVIITLLTIAVILLTIVIVTFLSLGIALLVKLRRIAQSVDTFTHNLADASNWFSPGKLFNEIIKAFRHK